MSHIEDKFEGPVESNEECEGSVELTTSDILENLYWTLSLVKEIQDIENLEAYSKRRPIDFHIISHIIIGWLCVPLLMILYSILKTSYNVEFPKYINLDSDFYWFFIPYPVIVLLVNRLTLLCKWMKYSSRVKQNNQLLPGVKENLYHESIVPTEYWSPANVSTLIKYFEQERVSNMGEALNMLDEAIRHQEKMEKLDDIERATYYS
ncbi:hypothetical protein [Paenibacillus aquistagni]|uniref:hypothetical protein n=1 Tax=Paenibacillus aquistagni TaxID=1852522 RepID=UPI000B50AA9B|nr:hypothetical protein [Paenibacillus aquistagni]